MEESKAVQRKLRVFGPDQLPEEFFPLWSGVFHDDKSEIKKFFGNFRGEIKAFALYEGNRLISELTQFFTGSLIIPAGRLNILSYAGEHTEAPDPAYKGGIKSATDPEFRHDMPTAARYAKTALTESENIFNRRLPDFRKTGSGETAPAVVAPVFVSYAICTEPAARGTGAGSEITSCAAARAMSEGAVSVLSPAYESLVKFYEPLGYFPLFRARAGAETEAETDASSKNVVFRRISTEEYGNLREEILRDRVHIQLSDKALQYVGYISTGKDSLFSINDGEAAAVLGENGDGSTVLLEILITEHSDLTEDSIAAAAMTEFNLAECMWRAPAPAAGSDTPAGSRIRQMPGDGKETAVSYRGSLPDDGRRTAVSYRKIFRSDDIPHEADGNGEARKYAAGQYTQGMIAAPTHIIRELEDLSLPPYFGFSFD